MVRPEMCKEAVGVGAEDVAVSLGAELGSGEEADGAEEDEEKSTLPTQSVRVNLTLCDSVEPVEDTF
jgi:hypothetical protein